MCDSLFERLMYRRRFHDRTAVMGMRLSRSSNGLRWEMGCLIFSKTILFFFYAKRWKRKVLPLAVHNKWAVLFSTVLSEFTALEGGQVQRERL